MVKLSRAHKNSYRSVTRRKSKPVTVSTDINAVCNTYFLQYMRTRLPDLRKQCIRLANAAKEIDELTSDINAKNATNATNSENSENSGSNSNSHLSNIISHMNEMIEDIDTLVKINNEYGKNGFLSGMLASYNKKYDEIKEVIESYTANSNVATNNINSLMAAFKTVVV